MMDCPTEVSASPGFGNRITSQPPAIVLRQLGALSYQFIQSGCRGPRDLLFVNNSLQEVQRLSMYNTSPQDIQLVHNLLPGSFELVEIYSL
jgi:hypothetical protein